MAGKRSATSELNHENWDREEDAEEAGFFKKASDDVLKRRVIKTARRRNPPGMPTENETPEEKKSVFGGFTAFAKSPANPTMAFGFLNKPDTNGMEKKTETSKMETNDEYYAKLKGLNESVSKWIKQHVDENPLINLKPIFTDYEKYFAELESLKKTVLHAEFKQEISKITFKPPEKKEESKPQFTFGVQPATPVIIKTEEKPDTTPQFKFGSKPDETKAEFTFGMPKTTLQSTPFGAPGTGFSFAGDNKPFTFANVKAPEVTEKKEEVADEDEPPKVEFTPVVEDGHIYSTRCKVFVKKDGTFGDRGVGNLYLKPVPDSEKVQLIVRADTNLGNLLCNFILSESVPTQRMGKKDVMLVCLPTPTCKPPPVPILLRVKSPAEADQLLQTLEKHKK